MTQTSEPWLFLSAVTAMVDLGAGWSWAESVEEVEAVHGWWDEAKEKPPVDEVKETEKERGRATVSSNRWEDLGQMSLKEEEKVPLKESE